MQSEPQEENMQKSASDYLSLEKDGALTGENNPLNKPEKGTDTRNPIIKFLEHFGELFVLNLIFVLACIPVITIGAALTALLTITNKMVRGEDGNLWEGYWKAFRTNFKPATILWVLSLLYLYLIRTVYMVMIRQTDTVSNIMTVLLGLILVAFTFTFPMLFPLVARYENTTFHYLKNSLILSVVHLKTWFKITVIWFVPIFVFLAKPIIFAYVWYFWLLIMCSASAYATSLMMQGIYEMLEDPKRQEKKPEEDSEPQVTAVQPETEKEQAAEKEQETEEEQETEKEQSAEMEQATEKEQYEAE